MTRLSIKLYVSRLAVSSEHLYAGRVRLAKITKNRGMLYRETILKVSYKESLRTNAQRHLANSGRTNFIYLVHINFELNHYNEHG